jgi:hypothetical protein
MGINANIAGGRAAQLHHCEHQLTKLLGCSQIGVTLNASSLYSILAGPPFLWASFQASADLSADANSNC